MKCLALLPLLLSLATAQFVFFGNQFGGGASRQPARFQQPQRFQAPAPSFQPARFGVRPAAAPAPTREGRFSSTFFRPSSPLNEVEKVPAEKTKEVASVVPSAPSVPTVAPSTTTPAPARKPKGNYQWQGKGYLLTWRTGRNNFAWNEGVSYCRSQGMKLVSLDSREKADHFLNLVKSDRATYFWAGGEVSSDSRTLSWQNGAKQPISRGQHPWSFTGRTGPQPDGGERCLAILNDVYRDGVKFHDVACHHRKPVVCEE